MEDSRPVNAYDLAQNTPESPVPGEAPLAILAFSAGHSWVT